VLEGVRGTGVCRPKIVCRTGQIPVIGQAGGVVCGCPDGMEDVGGSCEKVFTQSVCKEGEVLLPDNFLIGSKICSDGFSCKKGSECSAFQAAKAQLGKKGSRRRKEQYYFLREMVCEKNSRSVCCPDNEEHSLFTAHNLMQSMLPPKAKCVLNPCGQGFWPWVGKDDFSQCLKRDQNAGSCPNDLVEEDGDLVCRLAYVKTIAPIWGQSCGRRRRWSYGRCVRIFG
jgi:hypothetical protein